jgi:pimeloyl-ACP methyl ester carboxylesterase
MRAERRGWRAALGMIAVTLLVAACGGGGQGGGAGGASGASATQAQTSATQAQASATTTPLPALQQPADRCGPPADRATLLRFPSSDGVQLDGAMVGSGPAGVVLVHEYPADLCGFWPFAVYLSHHGMRALALDVRCFGRSTCPEGDAKGHLTDDVAAAVAELRRHGARRVGLVGASMGGAAVLVAGATVRPAVAAVVSLSGESDPSSLVGLPVHSLDAGAAVARLTSPTMYVVATGDRYASVEETRAMYRATRATDKRLEILSGASGGLHGWALLSDFQGQRWTPTAAKVAAFLRGRVG